MTEFDLRNATIDDVPFLVDTIVEAEKSGTDKFSYSTVFGLSEESARKYISDMLLEEVDGCELSISSFLVAEKNGKIAAALSAWIEGLNGIPSSILKGNLLNYIMPKECFVKATLINPIIREMHIEYTSNSIQLGAGYVSKEFRGNNLIGVLNNEIVERLYKSKPDVSEAYAQIFSCNLPSIKSAEKENFNVVMIKESSNKEICRYLPSNKKILMKKDLLTK
jgi:hypothetical protein